LLEQDEQRRIRFKCIRVFFDLFKLYEYLKALRTKIIAASGNELEERLGFLERERLSRSANLFGRFKRRWPGQCEYACIVKPIVSE